MNNEADEQVREEGTQRRPMGRPPKEPYNTRRWEVQLPADLDRCLEALAPGAGFDLMKEIVRDDPRIQAWIKSHENELKPFRRPERPRIARTSEQKNPININPEQIEENYLTVQQVAQELNVDPSTVRRWAEDGLIEGAVLLPTYGTKNNYRFEKAAFQRSLDRGHFTPKGSDT